MQSLQTLRGSNQTDELDVLGTALLDLADGVAGAAAGGQHRIQNKDLALIDVAGQLAVVLDRHQRLLVAVHADVADLGGGDQVQHAVHHAEAGAQDGDQSQLTAGQDLGAGQSHGGLDLDFLGGQVAGSLIAEQHRDLAHEVTELLGAGVAVTQQADFVLDQGMVNNFNNAHGRISLQFKIIQPAGQAM